jgi:hypothetical protein
MRTSALNLFAATSLAALSGLLSAQSPVPDPGPQFDAEGRLLPPKDYRSFVFLTSGFAMSYGPAAVAAAAGGVDVLDNVFVDRAAYDGFLQTGVWPESTLFVLELRTAEETGSIVTRGRFQTDVVAIEVALKDSKRFPGGGWGYFDFPLVDGRLQDAAKALPKTAGCNACHCKHGAVEQTFTQFYPTLFEVARAKGTVRKDFVGMPPDNRELEHRLTAADGDRCAALLEEVRKQWPLATVLRESSLNQLGYRLHAGKRQAAAIAVLRTAAQSFPESANAWDSLSEVLEAAGDRAGARAAVERGLQALPDDRKVGASMRAQLDKSLRDRKQRLE